MTHRQRKRRLRTVLVSGASGLLLGALVLVAHDLVDVALGTGDPPLRRRARQVVAGSPPYEEALDLARRHPAVRDALGGTPGVVLEACAVEDDPAATRLRFRLRLSGPDDRGALDVSAAYERHRPEPRWRLERARFTPDATGVATDLVDAPAPAR